MPLTLSVLDEATNGERRAAGPFEFETVAITLRELIRARVQQDVKRFNESESEPFRSLVQPEESERVLNGLPSRPLLVWQRQFEKAVRAFNGNGFLVLVDDCQVTDLDQTIHLTPQSRVTFLKLVPLMGG
jgi:hypothetical protein